MTTPTHKQEYSYHSTGKGKPVVIEEALSYYSIEDPGHPAISAADRATLFPVKAGWVIRYTGRSEFGGKWRFEVQADWVTPTGSETQTKIIIADIPPEGEALKAREIADSGRPDAYLWTVEDTVKGGTLKRTVLREHTEWGIDKKVIGKTATARPSTSDPTYYGLSGYAPPAPPAPTP